MNVLHFVILSNLFGVKLKHFLYLYPCIPSDKISITMSSDTLVICSMNKAGG